MRATRRAGAFVWLHRATRIALLTAVIALPLLAAGWLWVRQSPLVSVQRVQIVGVHGADAQAVDAALAAAAHRMSTLDVSDAALRAAVAPLRVVRELRAIPRFPHGLRIEVIEQLPVASLTVGGLRTAVAADGVVLGPALLSGSLPIVTGSSAPAPGRRVSGARLLGALAVLGAAPAPLARFVARVYSGPNGLTVAMRNGLLAYFGDAARAHAKWLSLARVLADPSSSGASYVDVRLPAHPAAGFPAGVNPPGAASSSGEAPASSESTVASLAAVLAGGSGTPATAPAEPASAAAGASSPTSPEAQSGASASPTTPEADGGASSQAGTTSTGESAQAPATGGG